MSNQFHKWPTVREKYGRAINAMPPFPSKQLNDDRSSTTPSIQGSATQVKRYLQFIDVNAYLIISRMLNPIPNVYRKLRNGC